MNHYFFTYSFLSVCEILLFCTKVSLNEYVYMLAINESNFFKCLFYCTFYSSFWNLKMCFPKINFKSTLWQIVADWVPLEYIVTLGNEGGWSISKHHNVFQWDPICR